MIVFNFLLFGQLSASQSEDVAAAVEQVRASAPSWVMVAAIACCVVVGVAKTFPGFTAKVKGWFSGLSVLPNLTADGSKETPPTPASQSLAASLAADMAALASAEQSLLKLDRPPTEIIGLFESQFAKRIAAAKAVSK